MPLEIERKWLLAGAPAWLTDRRSKRVRQGYLAITEQVELRVRAVEDERLLTVKHGHGEVRREVEVALEASQFDALWPLTESARVVKRRHLVPLEGQALTDEVDVYEGDLEGLVVAEIEFGSEADADGFEAPAWLDREITGDPRYENQSLALNGLPTDV